MRVAVAAPERRACGVSDYARFLKAALPRGIEVVDVAYPEDGSTHSWRGAAALADSCDLVHAHFEYSLFHAVKPYRNRFATFLRRLRPPVVVTAHDLIPPLAPRWRERGRYKAKSLFRDLAYAPFLRTWERNQYRRAAHWVVHTEVHRKTVAQQVNESSLSQILHPVPEARLLWRLDHRAPHQLVSLGFVKPHKGYLELAGVLRELRDTRWLIAGGAQDDRDRDHLATLRLELERLGIAERVEITGYEERGRVEGRAVDSRLAVFPFAHATGSGSVTWAVALGLPVLATDIPPFRELAAAGAGLELLPAEAPETWPHQIGQLLANPDRLAALAQANRAYARRHTYQAAGKKMEAIFRAVSSRSDSSRAGAS